MDELIGAMRRAGIDASEPASLDIINRDEYFVTRGASAYTQSQAVQHIKMYDRRIWAPNHKLHLRHEKADTVGITESDNEAQFKIGQTVAEALNMAFCQTLLSLVELYGRYVDSKETFDRGAKNSTLRNNFLMLYDRRLSFPQQLRAFNLFNTCATGKTDTVCRVDDPPSTSNVQSLVAEGNVIAMSHVNDASDIETYLFFDSTDHAVPFIFSANVGLDKVSVLQNRNWRAILDMFYRSYEMKRSTYWLKLVSGKTGILITGAGKSNATSSVQSALLRASPGRTFTLEYVPPNFLGQQNLGQLFRKQTSVYNEYMRYCDPHATVDFNSPADTAIHKSIQLLGLVHTVLPCLANHAATFQRNMSAIGRHLESDEDQLINIMTLMRSLQIDGEFERYFAVPARRSALPIPYNIAIADSGQAIDNWTTGSLPLASLIPAPRLI